MNRSVHREAKNSVFIDMFAQPKYQLELLRTLHPEMTDVREEDIETITLKQVVTNHLYNDLALLVKGVLMVFVEAQSTWSSNMAIRILLYLADTIQEYITSHQMDIHDSARLPLPKPEFYVIYTGSRKVNEVLSLRDDFFCDPACPLDLRAKVISAETEDIVGQYIIFCHVFDQQVKKYGREVEAARQTIRICQDRGVLVEYLRSREKEVTSIMITLFEQEKATEAYVQAQAIKARNEGVLIGERRGLAIGEKQGIAIGEKQGIAIGILQTLISLTREGLLSPKDAAARAGMPLAEFEREYRKTLS